MAETEIHDAKCGDLIMDWDDAYANRPYIENAAAFPDRWAVEALEFRNRMLAEGRAELDIKFGPSEREVFDIFSPVQTPKGLVVFVHGGYWLAFDKSFWSHFAKGAIDNGWSVAMPSYPLAPETKIPHIVKSVAQSIEAAALRVSGPIRLAGHSAGGHLATRMVCENAPLSSDVQSRIVKVLSISGLHDLRPLLHTSMGAKLFDDALHAATESPALLNPVAGVNLTCWVGENERPEFLRQNQLLVDAWAGPNIAAKSVIEPKRHHFNIIDGLTEADSELLREFLR